MPGYKGNKMATFCEKAKGNIFMTCAAIIRPKVVPGSRKMLLSENIISLKIHPEEPIIAPVHQPCPADSCPVFAFLGAFTPQSKHERAHVQPWNTTYTASINCIDRRLIGSPKWAPRGGQEEVVGTYHIGISKKSAQVRPFGMPASFGRLKSAQGPIIRDLQAA